MTEHGIELVKFVHAPRDLLDSDAESIRQFALLRVIVRQKFVERRIKKTNRGGQTI